MNSLPNYSGENPAAPYGEEVIELRALLSRLGRGARQIAALAVLGLLISSGLCFALLQWRPRSTSVRVVFAFSGYESGQYPDRSRFQADDLRAPTIIAEALEHEGINSSPAWVNQIRDGLCVESVPFTNSSKDQDRNRGSGEYAPDEYVIKLTLTRSFPLNDRQRELLLGEIFKIYRSNLEQVFSDIPKNLGGAFTILHKSHFLEYESVLSNEIQNITNYLQNLLSDQGKVPSQSSRLFRSPTTHLSFGDLLTETQFFSQTQLKESLTLLHQNEFVQDASLAQLKLDDKMKTLESQEREITSEQEVINNLLTRVESHPQIYLYGIKFPLNQPQTDPSFSAQGPLGALPAGGAYNLLLQRALDSGLKISHLNSEKADLLEQQKKIQAYAQEGPADRSKTSAELNKSLEALELSYQDLISKIQATYTDFVHQQFDDAIRLGSEITTEGHTRTLLLAGGAGLTIGFFAGIGLSLLGIYIGARKPN